MSEPSSHEHCLNCGEKLSGKFCAKCGQENAHLNVPFSHIIKEFLGDYIHFDSRFLTSIKLLLFKPGFLTKQFIEGKRASFLPPFRMYFFVSVLFFLIAPAKDNALNFTDTSKKNSSSNFTFVVKGNETVTNCNQLKMQSSDGKFYLTGVTDTEQLLRLIQSIPS
jgi:hypothetical protein